MKTKSRMTYLSYLAYADFFNTDHKATENSVKTVVQKFSDELDIEKELPWGPVAIESKFYNIFSNALIYMVENCNNEHKEYTVVIRGTNPVSLSTWIFQNFDVGDMVAWKDVSPQFSNDTLQPMISEATETSIEIHRSLEDDNLTIFDKVEEILKESDGEKVTINVAGHSLGGLMSSTLAQIMFDEFSVIYPHSEFKIFSFAGPTAGNEDFVNHTQDSFNERLSCNACEYDIATHVWNYEDMKNDLPKIYEPEISLKFPITLFLKRLVKKVKGRGYTHLFNEFNVPSEIVESRIFDDYLTQSIYQHLFPYIAEAIADENIEPIVNEIVLVIEKMLDKAFIRDITPDDIKDCLDNFFIAELVE